MTLVVNLFAGPGTGKSTTAAQVFAILKQNGVNTEIAHEYAKDLTWEDRKKTLRFQPYVTATQIYRVHRLIGEVDVIITDSPILLGTIYRGEGYTQAFEHYVFDTFSRWSTSNFFLLRANDRPYNPKGRGQSEQEAKDADAEIKQMLVTQLIDYKNVQMEAGGDAAAQTIASDILWRVK